MKVIGKWAERLDALATPTTTATTSVVRTDLNRAASKVHEVTDPASAREFVSMLRAMPLSAVALVIDAKARASLAAWTGSDRAVHATLGLRVPAVVSALGEILGMRVAVVMHDAKAALMALWELGLSPDMFALYDTQIAAACIHNGRHHPRTARRPSSSQYEMIEAEAELRRQHEHLLSLDGQVEQYGIVAGESVAGRVLDVYRAQHADVLTQGLDTHLHTVEFPFVVANARIERNGVHVDPDRLGKMREATATAARSLAEELAAAGIAHPNDRESLAAVLRSRGLGDRIPSDLSDDSLESVEHLDPLIVAFRRHRRVSSLAKSVWPIDPDGRVRPKHVQLAAATGRNSCREPNIVGIGRVFRPVVTAPAGRAILELDYGQIEVGVAAAEHGDSDLIRAFNSGDVYSVVAQKFYAAELSDEKRAMRPEAFKRARPDLRAKAKVFVLAVIYNMQPQGIADRFGVSIEAARRERDRFLNLFPRLRDGLEAAAQYGLARGYAMTVSGLRRQVDVEFAGDPWTTNFLRNTPIQGSAAVVFKRAAIALDRAFAGTTTMIVLPVHDAFVIECDAAFIDEVADTAAQHMRQALHDVYPVLVARVDVNKSHPTCWNKDGHADSLDRFIDDPTYTLDGAGSARCAEVDHFDPASDAECGPRADEQSPQAVQRVFTEEEIERRVHFA